MRKFIILGTILCLQGFAFDFGSIVNDISKVVEDSGKQSKSTKSTKSPRMQEMDAKIAAKKAAKENKSDCDRAGYTKKQAQAIDYQCLSLDEMKDYMSSNTYLGIKMGTPAKNLKDFKQITDEYDLNQMRVNGILCRDEIYTKRTKAAVTTICTRYGLVDQIIRIINLSTPELKGEISAALDKKYTLINDHLYVGNYQNIRVSGTNRQYKNNEDNIVLGGSGNKIIYASNVYDLINIFIKEKDKAVQKELEEESKGAVDEL